MARTYHKDRSSPIPLAHTQSQLYLSKSDPELDSNQKKKKKKLLHDPLNFRYYEDDNT